LCVFSVSADRFSHFADRQQLLYTTWVVCVKRFFQKILVFFLEMVFYGDYPMQWRTAEGCGASGTLPPTAIAKMADPQQTICISPRPAIPYVRGIGDAAPYSNRKNNSPQQIICIPPRPAIPYVRGIRDAAPHTAIAKITAPNKQFVFPPVLQSRTCGASGTLPPTAITKMTAPNKQFVFLPVLQSRTCGASGTPPHIQQSQK